MSRRTSHESGETTAAAEASHLLADRGNKSTCGDSILYVSSQTLVAACYRIETISAENVEQSSPKNPLGLSPASSSTLRVGTGSVSRSRYIYCRTRSRVKIDLGSPLTGCLRKPVVDRHTVRMSYGENSGSNVFSANLPTRLVKEYWDVNRATRMNSKSIAMRARTRAGTPP